MVLIGASEATLPSGVKVIEWTGCVLKVTNVSGQDVTFASTGTPYNATNNPHCDNVPTGINADLTLARFVGRSFRINPNADANLRVRLQIHEEGEINPATVADPNWQDVAVGFVNLQLAARYFENGDATNADADGDPTVDWYSGENLEHGEASRPADASAARMTTLSIGLTTRSQSSGVPSAQTPAFIGDDGGFCDTNLTDGTVATATNNPCGDSPSVAVTTDHVYRSTRVLVDIRNLSAGL
jgi:hypothetical protein